MLSKCKLSHSFRSQFLKKRIGLGCFVTCLALCFLVILTYNHKRPKQTNPFHNLEYHQKQEFFTNECLSIVEVIRADCQHHLSTGALIQLKCKDHRLFSGFCCYSLVILISTLGLPITHARFTINQSEKDYPATNVVFGCTQNVIKSQMQTMIDTLGFPKMK